MRHAGRLGARGRSTSPGKSTARRGGIHLKVELVKNVKTIVLVVNNNVEPDPFKEYSQEWGNSPVIRRFKVFLGRVSKTFMLNRSVAELPCLLNQF